MITWPGRPPIARPPGGRTPPGTGRRWRAPLLAAGAVATVLAVTLAVLLGTGGSPAAPGAATAAGPDTDPFAGTRLYGDPTMPAIAAARTLTSEKSPAAAAVARIAATPQPDWLGDWLPTASVRTTVAGEVRTARAERRLPFYVAYAIPHRDCGGYSTGGLRDAAAYRDWIGQLAAGLRGGPSVVVLEPDALAQVTCLPAAQQTERYALLAGAVRTLGAAGATVYLDAGHSGWVPAGEMAGRLRRAGVAQARGFALNVSYFGTTATQLAYGDSLVRDLGNALHFVVDTSRNGNGPTPGDQWCNPPGRALGATPTTRTGDPRADALLWIKHPGESDGTCNGGPAAGSWFESYAEGLAARTG